MGEGANKSVDVIYGSPLVLSIFSPSRFHNTTYMTIADTATAGLFGFVSTVGGSGAADGG